MITGGASFSCVSGVIAGACCYAGATAPGSSGNIGVVYRLSVDAVDAGGVGGIADEELISTTSFSAASTVARVMC